MKIDDNDARLETEFERMENMLKLGFGKNLEDSVYNKEEMYDYSKIRRASSISLKLDGSTISE